MTTSVVKLHARKSPSGSPRWTICHASLAREGASLQIREGNAAADIGTIMHDLAEHALKDGHDEYIESRRNVTRANVTTDGVTIYAANDSDFLPHGHPVDDDLCDGALRYVDYVRKLAMGGDLFVEKRLSIEHITGEADAKGTSDTVICYPDELCIVDLKGGWMRVMASYPFEGLLYEHGPQGLCLDRLFDDKIRFPNTQLVMYAEAVRNEMEFLYSFERVRLIVCQPRLDHVDEYVMSLEEFAQWVQWIREQAVAADQPNARVVPSEQTCQWCSVFPCAEAKALAVTTAIDDFDQINTPQRNDLGRLKRLVPLIRRFCDVVEQQVYSELTTGRNVDGWKLVPGDQGDREWAGDADDVRSILTDAGLTRDEFSTTPKLGSPAMIEKLVINSRPSPARKLPKEVWEEKLKPLIRRPAGGPKVVPTTDPRPPLQLDPASDFDIF